AFGAARAERVWASAADGATNLADVAPTEDTQELRTVSPDDQELQEAFDAEFGLTANEMFAGIAALLQADAGERLPDVVRLSRPTIVELLMQSGLTEAKVDQFLATFALEERGGFMR